MRVAIVHDWLYVLGGAERVLKEMLACFPEADVFALFDVLSPDDRQWIGFERARTSFLQKLPAIRPRHRTYLPLMPLAVEQFDLSRYDLVISSSYAVAKGVLTGPDQVHVSYVHSPMRYAWDLQHDHLRDSGLDRGFKSALARMLLHRMRVWDSRTAHGPDAIVANSAFVARRIRKAYGREARVIHPPVDVKAQGYPPADGRYFLTASRLVAYKNTAAVVAAFKSMPDLKLVVAGAGPERDNLERLAGANTSFVGFVPDGELRRLMAGARAFVFAAEEDFGIVPVEALAEGTPVLALGRGGVLESVVGEGPGRTGTFFERAEPDTIAACVRGFVVEEASFAAEACRQQAQRFSAARFRREFTDLVEAEVARAARALRLSHATAPVARAALELQ